MRYVYKTVCQNVYELSLQKHVSGSREDTVFKTVSKGWYINIGGEFSIYVGTEKPEIKIGEPLRLTIEGVEQ